MVYFNDWNYKGNGVGKTNRRIKIVNFYINGGKFEVVGNCKGVKFVDDRNGE